MFAMSLLMLPYTQYKTTCLSDISSHCLVTLPAKMSGKGADTSSHHCITQNSEPGSCAV